MQQISQIDLARLFELKRRIDTDPSKLFLFRKIPETLHRSWKLAAAHNNITMEEFGILAVYKYMENLQDAHFTKVGEALHELNEVTK